MNSKKLQHLIRLEAGVTAAVLLTGCNVNPFPSRGEIYSYPDQYSVGRSVITDSNIRKIELNWVAGSVTVACHEKDNFTFFEESSVDLTNEASLHYRVSGDTLYLQFAASGYSSIGSGTLKKDLTLYIPQYAGLESFQLNNVSSRVKFTADSVDTAILTTVSGDLYAEFSDRVGYVKAETVSGDLTLRGGYANDLHMESVSGNITATLPNDVPEQCDIETVSGDITMNFPMDAVFLAKFESASGALSSDFNYEKIAHDEYTCGSGSGASYKFETVSGDLAIRKVEG